MSFGGRLEGYGHGSWSMGIGGQKRKKVVDTPAARGMTEEGSVAVFDKINPTRPKSVGKFYNT